MPSLEQIVDIRNRGISKAYIQRVLGDIAGQAGPAGPAGANGQDLTGPLNIDGGKPQSYYAGMASLDAGYYNETYGGMLYGLDGGTP